LGPVHGNVLLMRTARTANNRIVHLSGFLLSFIFLRVFVYDHLVLKVKGAAESTVNYADSMYETVILLAPVSEGDTDIHENNGQSTFLSGYLMPLHLTPLRLCSYTG